MDALLLPFAILFVIGLFLLTKHDWKNKFLADKWGVLGIIALLLAIIGCYIIVYIAGLLVWGSDF
jgi:hypothetical protein